MLERTRDRERERKRHSARATARDREGGVGDVGGGGRAGGAGVKSERGSERARTGEREGEREGDHSRDVKWERTHLSKVLMNQDLGDECCVSTPKLRCLQDVSRTKFLFNLCVPHVGLPPVEYLTFVSRPDLTRTSKLTSTNCWCWWRSLVAETEFGGFYEPKILRTG